MAITLPTDYVNALVARLPRLVDIAPSCPFAAQLDAGRPLTSAQAAQMWAASVSNFRDNAKASVSAALHRAARARTAARRGSPNAMAFECKYLAQSIRDARAWAKRATEVEAH